MNRVTKRELVAALVRREAIERAGLAPRAGACRWCGRLVPTKPTRRKPAEFCGSVCRQRQDTVNLAIAAEASIRAGRGLRGSA